MKKLLLLAITLLFMLCFTLAAGAKIGDANGDGFIYPGDARAALRVSLGLDDPDEAMLKRLDVNHDGEVQPGDARVILRVSLELQDFEHPAPDENTVYTVITPATCTEAGQSSYVCACGEVFTVTVPAAGHVPASPVDEHVSPPTCTEDGDKDVVVYCAVCGERLSIDVVFLPATGHTPGEAVRENEAAQTCTASGGWDTAVYCAVCGEELSREKTVLPALGHLPGEETHENSFLPTCDTDGGIDHIVRCVRCGEVLTRTHEVFPAKGHVLSPAPAVAYIGEGPAVPCSGWGCAVCGRLLSGPEDGALFEGYYADLAPALGSARAGQTVTLIADLTCAEDLTVPAGVTLLLPYDLSHLTVNEKNEGFRWANYAPVDGAEPVHWGVSPADRDVSVTLTLAGCTLTVEADAALCIGGTYADAQPVGGGTNGPHAVLHVAEDASVLVRGRVSTCGYIKGEGALSLEGGSLYEPFVIEDFHGGTYSAITYIFNHTSPFNCYSCVNVQCPFTMDSASSVYGYSALFASASHNEATMRLISSNRGFIRLAEGTRLSASYLGDTGAAGYTGLGRTAVTVEGDVIVQPFELAASFVTVDTKEIAFPLPFQIAYTQKSGVLTLTQRVKIMPGAEVTVAEGAVLDVLNELLVTDGFHAVHYTPAGYHYPSGAVLKAAGISERGRLVVNGRMNVAAKAVFAGTVETDGGGTLVFSPEAVLTSVSTDGVVRGQKMILDQFTATSTTRTDYTHAALLADASGALVPAAAGGTYTGAAGVAAAPAGFTYALFSGDIESSASEEIFEAYASPETLRGLWTRTE